MNTVSLGTLYPEHQVVLTGSDVFFECYAALPVKWSRNSIVLHNETNMVLNLVNVTQLDSGDYICEEDTEAEHPVSASGQLLVAGKSDVSVVVR